jgi:hypothetical protein
LNNNEKAKGKNNKKTAKNVLPGAILIPSLKKYINGSPAINIAKPRPFLFAINFPNRYFIQKNLSKIRRNILKKVI